MKKFFWNFGLALVLVYIVGYAVLHNSPWETIGYFVLGLGTAKLWFDLKKT